MTLKTKGVLAFLVLAFGPTWLNWSIAWLMGFSPSDLLFTLISLPTAFTPALATVIVRHWITKEGFRDAGLALHLRDCWPYYLLAWVLPLLIFTLLVLCTIVSGLLPLVLLQILNTHVPLFGFSMSPITALLVLMVLTPLVVPLFWGEEFGWRGYLQLRLMCGRPALAALLTGLIWGIWHYPLLLMGYAGYSNVLVGVLVYTAQTIALSVILGWLRLRSGSVWVTSLMHAANNVIGGQFFLALFVGTGKLTPATWDAFSLIPLGILCCWILLSRQLKEGSLELAPSQ